MATITIHKIFRIATPQLVTATEGATVATSTWVVGNEYLTVDAVLAKLNADLSAVVTFAQDSTTGIVTAIPTGATFDVVWSSPEVRDYLGYSGDLDELSPDADTQPVGYWSGKALVPWGTNPRETHGDVVGWRGRTNTAGQYGTTEGTVTLWANTHHSGKSFSIYMARLYLVVSQWADAHLSIEDSTGHVTSQFYLSEGYAFEPQLLDRYSVQVDVGVTLCLE